MARSASNSSVPNNNASPLPIATGGGALRNARSTGHWGRSLSKACAFGFTGEVTVAPDRVAASSNRDAISLNWGVISLNQDAISLNRDVISFYRDAVTGNQKSWFFSRLLPSPGISSWSAFSARLLPSFPSLKRQQKRVATSIMNSSFSPIVCVCVRVTSEPCMYQRVFCSC